jgi:hypothetical protein
MSKVTLTTDLVLDDWNVMDVPETTIAELARLATGDDEIQNLVVYAKDGMEIIVEKREDGEVVIEVRDNGNIIFDRQPAQTNRLGEALMRLSVYRQSKDG